MCSKSSLSTQYLVCKKEKRGGMGGDRKEGRGGAREGREEDCRYAECDATYPRVHRLFLRVDV